jgi:hypothetical protein
VLHFISLSDVTGLKHLQLHNLSKKVTKTGTYPFGVALSISFLLSTCKQCFLNVAVYDNNRFNTGQNGRHFELAFPGQT